MAGIENKKGGKKTPFFISNKCSTGERETSQRYDFIPVDYVKCEVLRLDKSKILNNPNLSFGQMVDTDTGEIIPTKDRRGRRRTDKRTAQYKNMKLTYYPSGGRMTIEGSLHKLWNDGAHNWNQFHAGAWVEVMQELKTAIGLTPEELRIIVLEYGVNLYPPTPTDAVLKGCIYHKGKPLVQEINDTHGNYMAAYHSDYILKLYDKAKHYHAKGHRVEPEQVFRVEVKVMNWSRHRAAGIVTLQDFIQADKWPLIQHLQSTWNDVIFFEPDQIPKGWNKYSNPQFWKDLNEKIVVETTEDGKEKKKRRKSRSTEKKHRDRLKAMNDAFGTSTQKTISKMIQDNIQRLQA